MPLVLTPEAVPMLLGSDVRTVLGEFLPTSMSNLFPSLKLFKEALQTCESSTADIQHC